MSSFRDDTLELILRTLADPRGAARQICTYSISKPVLWNMVLLVVILSVLLTYVTAVVVGQQALLIDVIGSPMVFTLLMFTQMVVLIFAIFWVGQMLGGQASLDDTAMLVTWLQAMWLIAQVFQTIIMTLSPTTASMFGLISIAYGIWILIQFVSEANGFASWLKGAGVLVLSILGVVAGVSFLLSVIGISTVGLLANV